MMELIKKLFLSLQSKLGQDLFNTLLVTGALFTASFFSYLLQFFLGRTLPVEEFGNFTALLSLVSILTFFGTVVGYSLVKIFSELNSVNQQGKIKWLFYEIIKYSTVAGLFLGFICILFSSQIEQALKISGSTTIIIFGLYLVFSFVPIYLAVFFQGVYRLVWFSVFLVGSSLIRLLVPSLFVVLVQPSASVVYFGLLIGQLLTILLGVGIAKFACLQSENIEKDKAVTSQLFKDSFFNGLALLTLTIMIAIDVIAVKFFFTPYLAGIYSGVVTMGKIIVFGAGAVATVMFPRAVMVKNDYVGYKNGVTKFFILQIIFVLGSLFFFVAFPEAITHLLFGPRYEESIQYIPLYSVFVGFYVLINFTILALIAIGEKRFSLFMPLFLIVQCVGFYLFHSDINQVLIVNVVSMLLLFAFMVFNVVKVIDRLKNESTS